MVEADRSVQVNLRLPGSLKEAAEKAAASDHRSLTSLVEKLLSDHIRSRPGLEEWHERARARLAALLAEKRPQDPRRGFLMRSYAIHSRAFDCVSAAQLLRILENIHAKLGSFLSTPYFVYPFSRPELLPYFTSDTDLKRGGNEEILESLALPDFVAIPEFWRTSPSGLVSDVCGHFEDLEHFKQYNLEPGKWFSPFFMIRDLFALLHHALLLSEYFDAVESIEFRCEWSGLRERQLGDPEFFVVWPPGCVARVDGRVSPGEWSVKEIRDNWPEIIAELGGPVIRLFYPTFDCTPQWVQDQTKRFRP